ncbi:ArgR family transcriptional regulator [Thiospirochaeta perfilievii]|uniref:Arginine repressor n=1 Tax=Thiospirochaeta perfilievii TaxID=252967 RepID=A0A5C1Q879_9SPIO|nr:ArgR family transcriptional regulator [Thiospirochaeta perfilievii]QEN04255.1 ArgR family transcriptional regulator [Thiospirochaeta perfilievii]
MTSRHDRLKIIQGIIETNSITSQEQLLGILKDNNVNVTQATLSRDLKMLKVGKVSDGAKGYIYTLPSILNLKESEQQYINDFLRGFLSIAFSNNICVIKTLPGHANSTAAAIDNLLFDEVIGSIAGDDTIMVILSDEYPKEDFISSLNSKIEGLEL